MIMGIGTDILYIKNLNPASLLPGDAFLRATYTPAEQEAAAKREVPLWYYATRFAGKEAIFKCLGAHPNGARLSDIEILNDEIGAPHVTLHGALAAHAQQKGIYSVHISLSYDTDYAQAFAVATNSEPQQVFSDKASRKAKRKENPQ